MGGLKERSHESTEIFWSDAPCVLWKPGLEKFRKGLTLVPPHEQAKARNDFGIAETCYLHFQSVANQIRFCRKRQELRTATGEDRADVAAQMTSIAEKEIELAMRQYKIAKKDSRIAYEASNHYYYRPLDLIEKVLNCKYLIRKLASVVGGPSTNKYQHPLPIRW